MVSQIPKTNPRAWYLKMKLLIILSLLGLTALVFIGEWLAERNGSRLQEKNAKGELNKFKVIFKPKHNVPVNTITLQVNGEIHRIWKDSPIFKTVRDKLTEGMQLVLKSNIVKIPDEKSLGYNYTLPLVTTTYNDIYFEEYQPPTET